MGSSGDAGISTTYLCVSLEVAAALAGPMMTASPAGGIP
jgi:hypothetical protein